MELLPSDVESHTFRVVRKGYDPDEVQAYLKKVAVQMSSLEERAKIALVKADRLERKLFDAQRSADPVAGAYDDAIEIRRRVLAGAEEEADRIRLEANAAVAASAAMVDGYEAPSPDADTVLTASRTEAARIEEEAARLLEAAREQTARADAEGEHILAEARARADRIVASAVATADRTRDERNHLHAGSNRADGSELREPHPGTGEAPQSLTIDLTGETPAIEVSEAPPTDTKPSRYMSRSAGLPRIGESAGSVLQDMEKLRKREAD
jgi:DivIVA domain-containing protein